MPITRRALLKFGLALPPLSSAYAFCGADLARAASSDYDELTPERREQLLEDARAAWEFFEQPGRQLAGLVPANIWHEGRGFGSYRIVTMWDVGSILLATISAHSLRLIDDRQFAKRMAGLDDFLRKATYTYRGARLPNFRSSIDTARSIETGYDATDTARLFVALHVADRRKAPGLDSRARINSWDLDRTIRNGEIWSIKRRTPAPAEFNIYRYYVSRAYSLWNIDHAPVTSGQPPSASDGARKAFIEELGRIGPISSEPSLTEQVELGGSAYSQAIIDILDTAQKKRYRETGRLTCVSESPIDQEPWFTYQGYDVTREGEAAWTVYPWKTEKRWDTPEFAAMFRMVSSKAAFLWYAAYPSAYTEKLWQHVRKHARAPQYGFYPGVYESTGKPSRNIDVNTNATILEAVAYALRARQPLLS